jgi:DNA-binding transcriptional LysR family regulator
LDLRQISHFLAVVEGGAIGTAARTLGLRQPAVTKSIKALEASLGVPLFVRTRRGMELTPYGVMLQRRARSILVETERAKVEIDEIRSAQRGRINIAISTSFSATAMVPALARFRSTHPGVEIAISEDTIDAVAPRIVGGSLDFAIGSVRFDYPPNGIELKILYRDEIVPVTSAANPLASGRIVTLKELWPEPWVLGLSVVHNSKFAELFTRAGLTPPRPTCIYSAVAFALRLLREGRYTSLLSRSVIREDVEADRLRPINAPDLCFERTVGVATRIGTALTPAAQALLDHILHECAGANAAPRKRSRRRTS